MHLSYQCLNVKRTFSILTRWTGLWKRKDVGLRRRHFRRWRSMPPFENPKCWSWPKSSLELPQFWTWSASWFNYVSIFLFWVSGNFCTIECISTGLEKLTFQLFDQSQLQAIWEWEILNVAWIQSTEQRTSSQVTYAYIDPFLWRKEAHSIC